MTAAEMQRAVDDHPFWYHTIDVAPGVTTPGWFDLRPHGTDEDMIFVCRRRD